MEGQAAEISLPNCAICAFSFCIWKHRRERRISVNYFFPLWVACFMQGGLEKRCLSLNLWTCRGCNDYTVCCSSACQFQGKKKGLKTTTVHLFLNGVALSSKRFQHAHRKCVSWVLCRDCCECTSVYFKSRTLASQSTVQGWVNIWSDWNGTHSATCHPEWLGMPVQMCAWGLSPCAWDAAVYRCVLLALQRCWERESAYRAHGSWANCWREPRDEGFAFICDKENVSCCHGLV